MGCAYSMHSFSQKTGLEGTTKHILEDNIKLVMKERGRVVCNVILVNFAQNAVNFLTN